MTAKFQLILNKLFTGNKFHVVQFFRSTSLGKCFELYKTITYMLSTIKESDLGVQHSGSKKDVLSGEMGQELSNITLASINLGSVHKRCHFNGRGGDKPKRQHELLVKWMTKVQGEVDFRDDFETTSFMDDPLWVLK